MKKSHPTNMKCEHPLEGKYIKPESREEGKQIIALFVNSGARNLNIYNGTNLYKYYVVLDGVVRCEERPFKDEIITLSEAKRIMQEHESITALETKPTRIMEGHKQSEPTEESKYPEVKEGHPFVCDGRLYIIKTITMAQESNLENGQSIFILNVLKD